MRPLESVVRHEVRLDILGTLAYGGPHTAAQLIEKMGVTLAEVSYHVKLLLAYDLVGKTDEEPEATALYVATLDRQDDWVEEAITAHLLARRITLSSQLPFSSEMVGMKCDCCDRLLQYKALIVVVYDDDGSRRAKVVEEDTPGSGDAADLNATGKYHQNCYEEERLRDSSLPLVEG